MLSFDRLIEERGRPIGVAVIGATYMGTGLINAVRNARGMEPVALFDEDVSAAERAVATYAPGARVLPLADLCGDPAVDVVVDGTASVALGAKAACSAMENGKHVVSINIECDVTVGHMLAAKARENDVIYTVTAGDEPGELKAFYDHYDTLGFRVVAMGKGKNNPMNTQATPDDVRRNLPDNGITAHQVASFVDGSKTMFEMGCVGNAVGYGPDVPGMHGPKCTIDQIRERFRSRDNGGILEREGVVDFVTGPQLSGGIWIVVHSDDKRVHSDFKYLKIGEAPYYVFYQRHHNWFVDTPLSILQAALTGMPNLVPQAKPTCRVVAVAKRDLRAKETLDGIGGFTVYGRLEREDQAPDAMPLGLTEKAEMLRPVKQGRTLTFDDVEFPKSGELFELWEAGHGKNR